MLGTLMGIGGAMILTFYKGVEIDIWSTPVDLLHRSQQQSHHVASSPAHSNSATDYRDRILGCLLALGSAMGYAMWIIIQVIYLFS